MIRRKHKLLYVVYCADSYEDYCNCWADRSLDVYLGDSFTRHSKKELFEVLDRVIKLYPYVSVDKETHKYTDEIFLYRYDKGIVYNKVGYKR